MDRITPDLIGLAIARSAKPDLPAVKSRALARIVESTDLADIYKIILDELARAGIILAHQPLADFCADVFQDRQRAYPGTPIINRAGLY
ncbi:hypothetical protein LHP98_05215 [Rhodobacter sp. Har01]|uniref:hypothetical protein n=1 Tax=Rhodobacter sp. Har01 TaxID=2883999 RepID=UPI001D08708F|nr:hypothetical protein [Rhodobacter sp. Har01]MCB6177529.1 hypothetical protein [Rhodobacter sp. Har01]